MNSFKLNRRGCAVFILGAGASADSGLPTFRGEGGILENPEEVLSIDSNPAERESAVSELKNICKDVSPGPTYALIQKLAANYQSCSILTQNIDGIVRNLGIPYVEMHGNKDEKIVLYGQDIIFPYIASLWIEQHFADVFVIGTTMTLPYIRKIINSLKKKGGKVVHINPDEEYGSPIETRIADWNGNVRIKRKPRVKSNELWLCKNAADGLDEILSSMKNSE